MPATNWKVWDRNQAYGEMLYKRATGDLDEMESSKALCVVLSGIYHSGMTVVDVGCGAGHYLRSLRSRVDDEIDYTGIDATENYIALAKKAFPDARFEVGDIHDLPLADASYDIVINNNVIVHLPPPPQQAFRELIRVAKKHVVIRTVFGDRNYIIKEIHGATDQEGIESSEGELVAAEPELGLFNYFNMYTETYFRELVESIDSDMRVEIIKDQWWESFDNRDGTTNTGTRDMGGCQVSGNLLLDWRFIVLTKADA